MSAPAPTTTSSAKAPTKHEPKTRWPTDTLCTPSPTSATTPANSLPVTKGRGADIWYVLAMTSRSGKLMAPTWTRTLTSPAPSAGGDAVTSTTSGPAVAGAGNAGAHAGPYASTE